MTEALGMSAMMETPVVVIDVQRAGPATGVPTKTEQGDLWQMLGAGAGDFPKLIAAPLDIPDCFKLVSEMHNLADRFQCPGIILSDLLLSEGRSSVEANQIDFEPDIDRGELVVSDGPGNSTNGYKRYRITDTGISPRALPGVPGHVHTASTDEHDEDGVFRELEDVHDGFSMEGHEPPDLKLVRRDALVLQDEYCFANDSVG